MPQEMQRDRAALLTVKMLRTYPLVWSHQNHSQVVATPHGMVGGGSVRSCGVWLLPDFLEDIIEVMDEIFSDKQEKACELLCGYQFLHCLHLALYCLVIL